MVEALNANCSKQWSNLSKAQKRNLRRTEKSKTKAPNTPKENIHKTGFKYNTPIVRKLGLYKNHTKEKIKFSFFDKRLSLDHNVERIIEILKRMEVGENYDESNKIFEGKEFRRLLRNVLFRFSKIPLKLILDGHCPVSLPDFVPGSQLYAFMRSILHKCDVYEFYGGNKHRKILDRLMRRYLNSPRLMEMPLGGFVEKFNIKDIPWLSDQPNYIAQNAAAKLIKWMFSAMFEQIVQGLFKITDVSQRNCKKKVFYYRKSVWRELINKGLEKLTKKNYTKISKDQLEQLKSSRTRPNISELRFLPKFNKFDVRPIVKTVQKDSFSSSHIPMQKVLQSIAVRFPAKSDLSGKILDLMWSKFLTKLSHPEEKIYCVVADIIDAFGSIKLTELKRILKKYKTTENETVLNNINTRIFLHVVRFHVDGQLKNFIVKNGVLQGDPFSSLLSDIYYGYLTKKTMIEFLQDKKGMLIRGADDFLYMTTSKELAQKFLALINDGFPNYGCNFNKTKTQTNLIDESIDSFSYCGSKIQLSNRSICPNMDSYWNSNMAYAQSWPSLNKPPGLWICNKFISLCGLKLSSLYFNDTNPKDSCLKSLAANVYIALKRFTVMLNVLLKSRGGTIQEKWVWSCLIKGFRRFMKACFNTNFKITQSEVRYICLRTLIKECKFDIYPRCVLKGAKAALTKCSMIPNACLLDEIIVNVSKVVPGVTSTADWN